MMLANQGLSGKGQCLYLEYRYQDLSAIIIHVVYLRHRPQLLLDHKHTMDLFVSGSDTITVIGASC